MPSPISGTVVRKPASPQAASREQSKVYTPAEPHSKKKKLMGGYAKRNLDFICCHLSLCVQGLRMFSKELIDVRLGDKKKS